MQKISGVGFGKILAFGLIACALSFSTALAQDPPQYGTPFAKVPDPRDVSMYQVNMRVFSKTRNFQGVTDRLDNIKALGINVVYLMPIFPVGILKSINSPYSPRDYKSIGPEFGTVDDLRNLIDEAHQRGMAVILDWVADHTSWDNTWITPHPDWYEHDSAGNIVIPNGWKDSAKLNYANAELRAAMLDAMRFWIFTVNCDGFRCDYADGVPIDFWQNAFKSIKAITTHKFILMAEGGRASNFTCFDYNFGFSYYDQLKTIYSANQPVTTLDGINSATYGSAGPLNQVVRYITNHDVNSADGSPITLFNGRAGSLAAFTTVAFFKSVPMIYTGQEVGTPYALKFPFTGTTVDWTLNPDLPAVYAKIIAVRNNCEAIRRGNLVSYNNNDVCAFLKTSGSSRALVMTNLRNAVINFSVTDSLAKATWYDAFTGASAVIVKPIALQAYEYRVFVNAPLTSGLLTAPDVNLKTGNKISWTRENGALLVESSRISSPSKLISVNGKTHYRKALHQIN